MGKYFSATDRHAKAREFLELKQGTMTVLEYVAKFTELARSPIFKHSFSNQFFTNSTLLPI